MAEKIIIFMCSVLCSAPFFMLGILNKNSDEPITFFAGDESLKYRIGDIKAYNRQMSKLYRTYAIVILIPGFISLFNPAVAIVLLLLLCTLGLAFVYFQYKKILDNYKK